MGEVKKDSGMQSIKVKVYGITRVDPIKMALDLGADFIGINLYARSPRSVSLPRARKLIQSIPKGKRVVVDVAPTAGTLQSYQKIGFDYFQVHFDLSVPLSSVAEWSDIVGPKRLWLAPRIPPRKWFPKKILAYAETFLIDTYHRGGYGGSGQTGNWTRFYKLKKRYPDKTFILAGGLSPDNIAGALACTKASYVDVNSGVESAPGLKDPDQLQAFFDGLPIYAS